MPRATSRLFAALSAAVAPCLPLAACGDSSKKEAVVPASDGRPDLSGVTLTPGDQANGLRTLLTAAGTLKGTPYKVKWAEIGSLPTDVRVAGTVDTSLYTHSSAK